MTGPSGEAIERTLALGAVAAEPQLNEKGERLIWVEPRWVDKLNSIRRPGESYSEAIIRLDTQATLSKLRRSGESNTATWFLAWSKSRPQRGSRRPPAAFPASR